MSEVNLAEFINSLPGSLSRHDNLEVGHLHRSEGHYAYVLNLLIINRFIIGNQVVNALNTIDCMNQMTILRC